MDVMIMIITMQFLLIVRTININYVGNTLWETEDNKKAFMSQIEFTNNTRL